MSDKNTDWFWIAGRILVGLVLAYAGLAKLLEPAANFEANLLKYGVFPPKWIPLIANTLPWLEWILGSFLVMGYAPRLTAVASILLCFGFLITLSASRLIIDAGDTGCGCFGRTGPYLSLRQIFVVDVISFAILLRIVFLKEFPFSLHSFLLKKGMWKDDKKVKGEKR